MNTNENITELTTIIKLMIGVTILISLSVFAGPLFAIVAMILNCYNHYRIYRLIKNVTGEGNAT